GRIVEFLKHTSRSQFALECLFVDVSQGSHPRPHQLESPVANNHLSFYCTAHLRRVDSVFCRNFSHPLRFHRRNQHPRRPLVEQQQLRPKLGPDVDLCPSARRTERTLRQRHRQAPIAHIVRRFHSARPHHLSHRHLH